MDKIRRNPELIEKSVRPTLDRWLKTCSIGSAKHLKEWETIMSLPPEKMTERILANDERMVTLRQSSPIVCVLDNEERFTILSLWRKAHGEASSN